MSEYWIGVFHKLTIVAWTGLIMAIAIALTLGIYGLTMRCDNAVKSENWVSGVLRCRDAMIALVVAMLFALVAVFLP